jgi:assimilatory nitrate reductase catalytic subunit
MTAMEIPRASVKTTCPYCGVGCGVLAAPDGKGGASIAGDPDHPANFGRLCSKGSALGETLSVHERLLHPMVRCSNDRMEAVAWSDALDHVAQRFKHIIAKHGPNSVAFYLSGQLLTEDYYVANKLMKGFIGSANVDTNSRLCMSSAVAGHKRAFGSDTVPGNYRDLDEADLLVLVGSNAAWCHPVLYQRMLANKQKRGAKIVVIDPRQTDTASDANLFLGLKPGTDTALFSGVLVYLAAQGVIDPRYIGDHTSGFEEALAQARRIAANVAATALATGLNEADVETFFRLFASTEKVVTLYSQGVNQSAQGTDKVNAIINCHLATGRIGKPGVGPFSLTGQPNAMGGREVGGLANQLAAHMNFTPPDIDRVRRFWQAPRIATHEGLKAVQMFDAIGRGEIKALWVMGTNPAVSLPNADTVRLAMQKLDLLVISENVRSNDSVHAGAHVLLPAQAWGERSGTVTNSERRVSRQRPFMAPAGNARPDWWIVSEVAKRLGYERAFSYQSSAEIFREHCRLSAFENNGSRDFDLGMFAEITESEFDNFEPAMWPARADASMSERFFAEGGFYTNDKRARFIVTEIPVLRGEKSAARPMLLNTGRIRDQWHTMTRTGLSPRLGQHLRFPFVEIHPRDALATGVIDGGFAKVETDHGQCVLKVVVTNRQQPGMLFAPIHWSDETSSSARVGALVAPHTDPYSGQPENKATPANLFPCDYPQHGFVLSRDILSFPADVWWTRVAVIGGYGYLLASKQGVSWQAWFDECFAGQDVADYVDAVGGVYRAAAFDGDRLMRCLFVEPTESATEWDATKTLFADDALTAEQRRLLLSGKTTDAAASTGPIVCACFGVGRNTICDALTSGAARSHLDLGVQLKAGTNCGSCIPELRRLVTEFAPVEEPAARREVATAES